MKSQKYYIGYKIDCSGFERFKSANEPTVGQYGYKYLYVIGPFITMRAAVWAEKYGLNNPHFRHVDDAETLSKLIK